MNHNSHNSHNNYNNDFHNNHSNSYNKRNYNLNLLWLFAAYICIYAVILIVSKGIPYVMDGNETYSSLVHAYNMYFGDWGQHFGLANEAFSPDPAAHPVIHTHQGNWPRILSFILFALGARTAEAQVVIHVFTIGAVSVWLMHRLFTKLMPQSRSFALIASLIFISDYLYFAQWQVVTYRVWHAFFVFLSLNCAYEFDKSKSWRIAMFFNFMAIFYWELVFAFYLSVWTVAFYFLHSQYSIKKTFKFGLLLSAGGLSALAILFTQLSMFMGWRNVIQDFNLTFNARNLASDPEKLRAIVDAFYSNKNIAFFYNIVKGQNYNTVNNFIRSFLEFGFQSHTPILGLLAIITVCYMLVLGCYRRLSNYVANTSNSIRTIASSTNSARSYFNNCFTKVCTPITTVIVFNVTYLILIFCLSIDNKFLGIAVKSSIYYQFNELPKFITALVLAPLLAFTTCYNNRALGNAKRLNLGKLIGANLIILSAAWLILVLPNYYSQWLAVIWFQQITAALPTELWRVIVMLWIWFVVNNFLWYDTKQITKAPTNLSLETGVSASHLNKLNNENKLNLFIIAGLIAYALVYILSTGYVYSGYLQRYAPLTVFLFDVAIACLVWQAYTMIKPRLNFVLTSGYLLKKTPIKAWFRRNVLSYMVALAPAVAATVIFMIVTGFWLYTQVMYFKLLPPTNLIFIKNLRTADLHGKNLIVNNYALPFAFESHSWGFSYPQKPPIDLTKELVLGNEELRYLWYKNKTETAIYAKPDLFICFEPNSMPAVAQELLNSGNYNTSCTAQYLALGEVINQYGNQNRISSTWGELFYKRNADLKYHANNGRLDFIRPALQLEARRWGIFSFNFATKNNIVGYDNEQH